jgi:hypothetical protein
MTEITEQQVQEKRSLDTLEAITKTAGEMVVPPPHPDTTHYHNDGIKLDLAELVLEAISAGVPAPGVIARVALLALHRDEV